MRVPRYGPGFERKLPLTAGDALVLLLLAALIALGARLALRVPAVVAGRGISLEPSALPWYALFSVGRMALAYLLSLVFSLVYGYAAARSRGARAVLMPLLDVLQSVPILSFLPVVLLSFTAVLPEAFAAELASIVLIFTSQAWNMTFSFYQSVRTTPQELREAAAVFRLGPWLRFRTLELPFAAPGLVWNSMMSWSGGWFFLMAAEIFVVGKRDFRLPGLGSYLHEASAASDWRAIALGVATLVLIVVLLDLVIWRPVLAWSEKFKLELTGNDEPRESHLLDLVRRSWLLDRLTAGTLGPLADWIDRRLQRRAAVTPPVESEGEGPPGLLARATLVLLAALALYGTWRALRLVSALTAAEWLALGSGLAATLLRVTIALAITLAWTVPLGVLIGSSRRWAAWLQPVVQILASIPATALFPVLVVLLLGLPGGLSIAAVLLMLMGTQWYLLFNVIAGAAAIPEDLRLTTDLLRLSGRDRWRALTLPAIFPFLITGMITASGGAWNASVVAEHVTFGERVYDTPGVGALIAEATAHGNYPMLTAATLALVLVVVLINRFLWLRLYRRAEERYRME